MKQRALSQAANGTKKKAKGGHANGNPAASRSAAVDEAPTHAAEAAAPTRHGLVQSDGVSSARVEAFTAGFTRVIIHDIRHWS